jgi:hypothetical protein
MTVYYTRKSGGTWNKAMKNLKHNFLALFAYNWRLGAEELMAFIVRSKG